MTFDDDNRPVPDSNLGITITVGGGCHSGDYRWVNGVKRWISSKQAGIQLSKLSLLLRMISNFSSLDTRKPTEVFVTPRDLKSSFRVILALLTRNTIDSRFRDYHAACAADLRHFVRTFQEKSQYPHEHLFLYRQHFNLDGELIYCPQCLISLDECCEIDRWVKNIFSNALLMLSLLPGPPYAVTLSSMFTTTSALAFVKRDCVKNDGQIRIRGNPSVHFSEYLIW